MNPLKRRAKTAAAKEEAAAKEKAAAKEADAKNPAETPDATSDGTKSDKPEAAKTPISVNAQFIKDLSFEAPAVPEIFNEKPARQPDININVEVKARPLREKVFEVTLHINAECKYGEKVAFLLELAYGGVFTLKVPSEHLQAVLLIECPRLLFPFARNILADVSRDGGFPPLMLGPLDFVAMYQNKVRQLASEGDGEKAKKEAANPK
ncbi:MAG: protein-export chaperone SecB [Rhodospirillales bacterium]|nr:protein-export chaperone SecB [Rhodospirillales bacterium]